MQKYGWSPPMGGQFPRESYQYTDASGMTPHMSQQMYGQMQHQAHPTEMDATTTAPIEMDASGHEQQQQQHQPRQPQSPGYPDQSQNQLGIRS